MNQILICNICNPEIEWSELLSVSFGHFPRIFEPPLFVWVCAFDREKKSAKRRKEKKEERKREKHTAH